MNISSSSINLLWISLSATVFPEYTDKAHLVPIGKLPIPSSKIDRLDLWSSKNPESTITLWYDSRLLSQKSNEDFTVLSTISPNNVKYQDISYLKNDPYFSMVPKILHTHSSNGTTIKYVIDLIKFAICKHYLNAIKSINEETKREENFIFLYADFNFPPFTINDYLSQVGFRIYWSLPNVPENNFIFFDYTGTISAQEVINSMTLVHDKIIAEKKYIQKPSDLYKLYFFDVLFEWSSNNKTIPKSLKEIKSSTLSVRGLSKMENYRL